MPALPKTDSPQVQEMAEQDANYLNAYNVCLEHESSTTNANQLRYVRILGFLLLNAPSRGIRSEVAKCIHSYDNDPGLFDLGAFFERYFILPCGFSVCHSTLCPPVLFSVFSVKKDKGRTPKPSDHPSRPSFEVGMNVDIKEAPKNHQDAKDRVSKCLQRHSSSWFLIPHLQQALIRDNWRCAVTGIVDLDAPAEIIAQLGPEAMGTYTECAHIIPEATLFGVNPKTEENSQVRDYRFSYCGEYLTQKYPA